MQGQGEQRTRNRQNALHSFFYQQVCKERKETEEMLARKDISQDWKLLQQRNRLMEFQPHISAAELRSIKCPVLVFSTDRDIIREEHTLFIYRNIPKANLCILPGENHYVSMNNPGLFNATVDGYFDAPFGGDEMRQ